MTFQFSPENCTSEAAAAVLNNLALKYEAGSFSLKAPADYAFLQLVIAYSETQGSAEEETEGTTSLVCILAPTEDTTPDIDTDSAEAETHVATVAPGETFTIAWTRPDNANYIIANVGLTTASEYIEGAAMGDESGEDTGGGETGGEDTGTDDTETVEPGYIYPTGTVSLSSLEVTPVGFKNHQEQTGYTHIKIMVAEIQANGTVGGAGHVWESDFIEKGLDYVTNLGEIVPMCEGHALTDFNVSYSFCKKDDAGNYAFVGGHIVGGVTTVTTFRVSDVVDKPVIGLAETAFCLDPVTLEINRLGNRDIQTVRVSIGNYIADFEFYPDRNTLKIDIAEYLKTLWANVDVFEFQQMETTVIVTLFDAIGAELEKSGTIVTVIYGKNPDPSLSACSLRVQWLDKYGYLHDEYFRIVEHVSDGETLQKYVVNGEEREDKSGEKSITLAFVGANNQQREALKTIVFADHVRAYIGENWKRVKVANSYKTGKGREKQNFEFTIKYAL